MIITHVGGTLTVRVTYISSEKCNLDEISFGHLDNLMNDNSVCTSVYSTIRKAKQSSIVV